MTIETPTNYIDDLDDTYPAAGDNPSEGDDHIRNTKTAVQGSFTSLGQAAVTATAAELNIMDGITSFLDEDDMASDSATSIASQQSIKKYVDDSTDVTIIEHASSPFATTSGGTVNVPSIPTGTKRVILNFNAVSSNAASTHYIRLGDSSGIVTTNYLGSTIGFTNAGTQYGDYTASNQYFTLGKSGASSGSHVISGRVVFERIDSTNFIWAVSGHVTDAASGSDYINYNISGQVTLSSELTQLSVYSDNAFDAGSFGVHYEK